MSEVVAELLLLRERLRRLEAFRQMVAAGPAGMTDYREWRDYVCEMAMKLA